MRKNSKQREEIRRVLASTKTHPTADWVYDNVKQSFPNISLATVYRNLSLLVEEGQALKLTSVSGPDRFDATIDVHYHIACEKCGNIFDVNLPVIVGLEEQLETLTGFKVKSHTVNFLGTCTKCRNE